MRIREEKKTDDFMVEISGGEREQRLWQSQFIIENNRDFNRNLMIGRPKLNALQPN